MKRRKDGVKQRYWVGHKTNKKNRGMAKWDNDEERKRVIERQIEIHKAAKEANDYIAPLAFSKGFDSALRVLNLEPSKEEIISVKRIGENRRYHKKKLKNRGSQIGRRARHNRNIELHGKPKKGKPSVEIEEDLFDELFPDDEEKSRGMKRQREELKKKG